MNNANNEVKCPNCGAPIVNGRCTYCNYTVPNQPNNTSTNPNTVRNTGTNQGRTINQNFEIYKNVVTTAPKKKSKLKIIIGVIVGLAIIGALFGNDSDKGTSNSGTSSSAEPENNSVWAADYTDISEFDYYLDGENLYIKDYNGREKKVRINSTYTIDGTERHVVALTDGTFALGRVDSVIVPEGVKRVENNTFNSCGIKFLYLPSTLEDVPYGFWSYFHDMEKIYYGGTEEQFWSICEQDRGDIDVKEIVYGANPDELK